MKKLSTLLTIYLVPLSFIGLYYGINANQVAFQNILRTVFVTLISGFIIMVVLLLLTRSREKTILLSNLFFFLFFNFGNVSRLLRRYQVISIADHLRFYSAHIANDYCAIILGSLFCVAAFWVIQQKKSMSYERVNKYFALGMVGITVGYLASAGVQNLSGRLKGSSSGFYQEWQATITGETSLLQPVETLPDIYYIVLDGYGSAEVLENFYNFNNQPFLKALAERGFVVSQGGRANYKQTVQSISSLLNMDYVNGVGDRVGVNSQEYFPLAFVTEHNRVFEQLRRVGYRIDTFTTGYEATEIESADVLYKPEQYPNSFEEMIVSATPLSLIWDSSLYAIHRERIRFNLQNLAEAGRQEGPNLVFAHIFAPHPPFVFGADGEEITPSYPYAEIDANEFLEYGTVEEYKTGYIEQLKFINGEVFSAIEEILHTATTPPIIVIQSDHGPGSEFDHQNLENSNLAERYPILYAALIPCENRDVFPQDITPVNSFRYIFNSCFDAGLPYLENRQYYSSNLMPYAFTDVTDVLKNAVAAGK